MFRRLLGSATFFIFGALLTLVFIWYIPAVEAAPSASVTTIQPPTIIQESVATAPLISYQGRLLDPLTGQAKPDGPYTMAFRLYAVDVGGAALWTENKSVPVNKGLFSTLLGDTTALDLALFNGQDLFLGITIGSDPEMTPRQRLSHIAYAIHAQTAAAATTATSAGTAGNADRLDGQDATAFALAAHQHESMSGNNTNALFAVTQSGTGYGIQSITASTAPAKAGVYGVAGTDSGVSTPAKPAGVLGRSLDHFGVVGYSRNDDGVYGHSTTEYGVRAESGGKAALLALGFGSGTTNYGVEARSSSTHGVYADGATYGFYTPDKIFAGAGYSDIAEHMPAADDVSAGDVVVIDPDHDERVIKSYRANDPTVAGVISTEPAMLIGKADSPSPLALAGRVPVKVSAENGPIQRGDLLTTAATPGHAMKATPVLVNGLPFYTPGTIIGKAMGELETGVGTITVLVMPQ